MNKKFPLLITAVLLGTFVMQAQRDNRRHEKGVVSVVNNDTTDNSHAENAFKSIAPSSTKDNGLPRFAIMGKEHKFYLGIGGQFLGEAVYDIGAEVGSNTNFTPSAFTPALPGNGAGLGFAWQTSSIYLNFVALPLAANKVGLFFKANFKGANNTFHCSHFYAKYRGLTIGYTSSIFTDGEAEPMTIDSEGQNGYPDNTLYNISWVQKFTKHVSGAIGLDAPVTSLLTNAHTAMVKQRVPSIPFYVQYAWDDDASHVRLSGILRPMQYRDAVASRNGSFLGRGVQLSGETHIAGPVSLQLNAAYGHGIGSYIQDDEGVGLDGVPIGDTGRIGLVRTLGATAGVNIYISPKLSSNIVYSHLTNWLPRNAQVEPDTYRYGDYFAANVIYTINKFVSTGIEYDYGHRQAVDGACLHASRIQAQLAITF